MTFHVKNKNPEHNYNIEADFADFSDKACVKFYLKGSLVGSQSLSHNSSISVN